MVAVMQFKEQAYAKPDYQLTVNGRDISRAIKADARLISLTLTESRGDEADQLDIELDDSDGALDLPKKGAELALRLGWEGLGLVDKGTFEVDEVEHQGAPDRISIRARAAEMRREMRTRKEKSWHDTTIGAIVETIAKQNNLTPRVDPRLAKKHDAVATVKKGHLVFLPINGTKSSSGQELGAITITRAAGDQHRYHSADRNAYSGVRAYWHDKNGAEKKSVLVGTEENEKRLKDTYGSEADAMAAARAEQGRVERGKATMELTLALAQPELMPQTGVTLAGFKREIDATPWLAVKLTHSMGDQGFTTRLELETKGAKPDKKKD